MVNMSYAIIGAVFMAVMAIFAFVKGGQPERNGAGVYLLAWFSSIVVQQSGLQSNQIPFGVFLIDVAVLGVFIALAWKSRRSWPVWASAIQLITVMSHILLLTDAEVSATSLYTVMNLNGYLIIGCLIVGTFWAWQDRKAAARDR